MFFDVKKDIKKNLESSLFEKKMDFCFIKSTVSSTTFENARVSTRMPYAQWGVLLSRCPFLGIPA